MHYCQAKERTNKGINLCSFAHLKENKSYSHIFELWSEVKPNAGYRVLELSTPDKDIRTKDCPALDLIGFEGRTHSVVMIANPTTKTKTGFQFSRIAKGKVADV